jgi:signal transduction histidine kinase
MSSASRQVSGWLALVDRLAPRSIHGGDPVQQRRARLLVFNTLGFIASGIVQCLLAFAVEPPRTAWFAALPFALGSLLGVGAIYYLRWRGGSEVAARMTLGGAFVVTVIASYSEGGLASPGLAWFVVMPVVASALIGTRAAVFVAGSAIVVVLVFALLQVYDLPVPAPPSGDAYAIKRTFQICSAALLCAGLVYMNGVFEEETQQALVDTRDAATQASLAKSRFVANVSHEIRTPMTAILGYTDVLAEPGLDEKERRDAIETLRRNGHQLLALINDMLDLSRIEADGLEIRNREVSPASVVQQVVALLRDRAKVRRLSLQLELSPGLPATIWTDPVRLQQVLVNLLGNAIKFTEQGGIRVVVSLDPQSVPPLLRFDVIDSGIGIAPTDRERIFDPFSQADATESRRYGGTGLGLAISRRLAQKLGGDLELTSEVGRGSTFSMLLPILEPSAEEREDDTDSWGQRERLAQSTPATGGAFPSLQGRVLVAEDGLDNQRLIARVLGRAGLDISLAANGRMAVDDVLAAERAGTPFDLVLMDMQMPELDGYAATQALRDSGFTRPIIALSAHAMREDQERCIAAGCDAFASKPIDRRKLLELLAQYLGKV